MAGLAALTTLLPQHLKLHYFALYADVKERSKALALDRLSENGFSIHTIEKIQNAVISGPDRT